MMYPKQEPVRSQKLRDSARGKDCTLRIPGVCCGDPETTVLAHLPYGGRGMGLKAPDTHAVYACRTCHDAIDGRGGYRVLDAEILECCLRGICETQAQMIDDGLIVVQ